MVLFLFDLPFSYETKVYHVTIAAPRGELIRGCCLCTVLRRAEYHFSTRSSDHGNGTKHFEQASRQASRQTSRDSMHQQDHCNVVDIKLPHWKENHMDRLLKSKGTIVHSLLITKKKSRLEMSSCSIDRTFCCNSNGFFCPSPLPFGRSTVLSLTCGQAGNRISTGSLSATQECRDTN